MNPLFPTKILIQTGPAYKDVNCSATALIEVNLIPPGEWRSPEMYDLYSQSKGSLGTPPSGMLSNNIVQLSLKTTTGIQTYQGLNMSFLVNTLANLCKVADLMWDPRKDLLFLCQHYSEEIQLVRDQIQQKTLEHNFLGTPFFNRLNSDDQRKCYQVIQGKALAPVMGITPPTTEDRHRRSHSASNLRQERMPARDLHDSGIVQRGPILLSPPSAEKPRLSQRHSTDGTTQTAAMAKAAQVPLASPHLTKETRSRYRPITAQHSRNDSANGFQAAEGECLSKKNAPLPSQRSMIDINGNVATLSPDQVEVMPTRSRPPQKHVIPSTLTTHIPGQQYLKSQVGLAATTETEHLVAQQRPLTHSLVPPKARKAYQRSQQAILEDRRPCLPGSSSDGPHAVSAEGDTSSSGSCTREAMQSTRTLGFIGSEGFHHSPQPAKAQNTRDTEESSPVFELDATSQENNIIAELAGDIEKVLRTNDDPTSVPAHNVPFTNSPPSEDLSRQTMSQLQSAPLVMLPTSLLAGGSATPHHQRSTSDCVITTPQEHPPSQALAPETNASRYSRYHPPPLSMLDSNHTSPQLTPAPLSVYKAYQPQSISLSPPNSDVCKPRARSTSFGRLKDVDGARSYFRTHKREASHDSQASSTSHDSSKLAQDYQAELPSFDDGYGSATQA
jgi:hypothetical protein